MEEALKALSQKIEEYKANIQTEEATKTAFVLPFIALLGYDVFNPDEVQPEFTADIGTKKGEKVDYALLQDGNPILIIECKYWEENLEAHNSQLYRYFAVTQSRFALLTNGVKYLFFSDLENDNKMDARPFLEVDLEHLKDSDIQELAKFHKSSFDVNTIIDAAGNMKYTKSLRKLLEDEFSNPSEEFTRFLAKQVYTGKVTSKLVEQFSNFIKKAISQHINEIINDRLKKALKKETDEQKEQSEPDNQNDSKIITTEEEIEGFNIVKAIVCKVIDSERVFARDTQSYFGVLLDNTNRKPICRLHFNSKNKYIGLFDNEKTENRIQINRPSDIYNFSEHLIETTKYYDAKS
ncbi:restriction endonuclease [bacterium]|nr:restriction endonuclease [bacterium]